MKQLFILLFAFCSITAMGQYPVSSINISMPAQPSASTADWATSMPPVMITAQATLRNGQVPGNVVESRILVTIKLGGTKKYGIYTSATAPQSGFNSAVKNWSGANAVALLGKDEVLPPGTYELCVQFFSGNAPIMPLSNEVCKSFTIPESMPTGQFPVTLNVTMPPRPSANTADWSTAMPPVMITAQTQLRNGQVPGNVAESRILVIIRLNPPKKYGMYTANTAPQSGINSAVKNWSGAAAVSLLGQDYILPPGDYEFCAQLFGVGPVQGQNVALSNEVCKPFTIADTKTQVFTPPANLTPVDKKIFTENEIQAPITFRWTPLCCKVGQPFTYKLRIWEVGIGNNVNAVRRSEEPTQIVEVKDQTQAVVRLSKRVNNGLIYEWDVQAVTREGKVLGESDGTTFSYKKSDEDAKLKELSFEKLVNVTPVDGKIFTKEEALQLITLRWTPLTPRPPQGGITYKVRVIEIKKGQSMAQAFKENPPVEIIEVKDKTETQYKLAQRCNDCEGWVWNVEALRREARGNMAEL